MPIRIRRTDKGFEVSTPGGIKAKGTTRTNAERQRRLLNAIEHDPDFKPRKRKK